MQLFFKDNFENDPVLDETDSKHCIKVLRHGPGDSIKVTDGKGNLFSCIISEANPRKTRLTIVDKQFFPCASRRYVHLAVAPVKNIDRMTYLVEKAVEIGVREISFLTCENSERREIKTDRMERVAVAAMKQSLGTWLPVFHEMEKLDVFLRSCAASQKFIAHLSEDSRELVNENLAENVCILIGPEGDFSPKELLLAAQSGFQQVTLGASRLRTETAGLVAVTLLNLLN